MNIQNLNTCVDRILTNDGIEVVEENGSIFYCDYWVTVNDIYELIEFFQHGENYHREYRFYLVDGKIYAVKPYKMVTKSGAEIELNSMFYC